MNLSKTEDRIKTEVKKLGKTAQTIAFAVALPLLASNMIGCRGGDGTTENNIHTPGSRTSAPTQEGSAGASAHSVRDASTPDVQTKEDSQVPGQTVARAERESEQTASPGRTLFGQNCHGFGELNYKGYSIEVDTVEQGEDSVGLWTGNLVGLDVYELDEVLANGASLWSDVAHGVLRSRFEDDVLELSEGLSVSVGYALQPTAGHSHCAEVVIEDENPVVVNVTETVDHTVLAEDPSVVLDESLQALEVSFPDGFWTVQEPDLGDDALIDKSDIAPLVDLGIFGKEFISSVTPESETVELVEQPVEFVIPEGKEASSGNITVTAEKIFVDPNTNSIQMTVRINNGERDIGWNPVSSLHGIIEDLDGTEHTIVVVPAVLDADTLAVYVRMAKIIESFHDGQVIERDGSKWEVDVSLNEANAVSSLTFTRLPK